MATQRRVSTIVVFLAVIGLSVATASAGVIYSTLPDQATWPDSPVLNTAATPQASLVTNQQVTFAPPGTSHTQTIVTGGSSILLDKILIYSGGKGGGDARLNIYPAPVGGEDTAGFVNTSFSTDLLNGGAGLQFTFFGSGGPQYIVLDLTGTDEITLAPNTKYGFEIDVLAGQWSWLRSNAGTYPNGNLYQGGTEQNFNGTPPSNNRGERFQVGGTPQRDGGLALYVPIPEPGSLGLLGIATVGLLARRRRVA